MIEVEGSAAAIQDAVALPQLPRSSSLADAPAAPAEQYAARTGRAAALALAEPAPGERPAWDRT